MVGRIAAEIARVAPGAAKGVVAVSGGRDSMALMVATSVMVAANQSMTCTVAHVHHHQRPEADDECELVRRTAASLGLAFELRHLEVDPGEPPSSLREARYRELLDVAIATGSSWIATAHQAQDQLETVLLAMVRGAGPAGLVGMGSVRALGEDILLVRPMLEVDRAEVTALCEQAGVVWCDDPGNEDPGTLRGLLRRDVLPVLESMRPGVAKRLSATREIRQAAADALKAAVLAPFEGAWPRAALAALPMGLRRATLHAAATALAGGADGIGSEPIRAAARAVADTRMHRRCYELGCGVELTLEAAHVRIDGARSQPEMEAHPPR
ncbi:MAG: tRNA lysidine(34) synthetase TilS [Phycisphaerales bacterium]|nr:tRNA lysidine(34) synthetase TilS [Phycisphaerales bacterium]